MDSEIKTSLNKTRDNNVERARIRYWILVMANYIALFVGSASSTLLSRFYFVHGGYSRWVSTWVQSTGFPLLLFPIYAASCCGGGHHPFSSFTLRLLIYAIIMGVFLGINNFIISWGVSYLPVSTSSLLLSSQLAFNLVLSVLLVNQKITFTNLNCVILLTLSSVILALGSSNDRPDGVSCMQFSFGFLATLAAALMFAIYLPIMEIIYRGVKTYQMVMEMQLVMEAVATVFAAVGMVADGGFWEMRREGRWEFNLGEGRYWVTIGATVACWQMCFMGMAGMIFLTSSLNSGICMTALLTVNVLGGVIMFRDMFGGQKAVSLGLCLWGFASYLYGEYRRKKTDEKDNEMEKIENGNDIVEIDGENSV